MYVCLYAIPVGRAVGLLPHFDLFTLYLPHVTAYIVSTVEALGENLRYYSREIIRDFRARFREISASYIPVKHQSFSK